MFGKLLLSCCLIALSATCAMAEVKKFSYFSIDLPKGWVGTEDGNTVGIVAPETKAVISITIDEMGKDTAESIANDFAKTMEATAPIEKDGKNYLVKYDVKGVNAFAFISSSGTKALLLNVIGSAEGLEGVLESIQGKTPEIATLFE